MKPTRSSERIGFPIDPPTLAHAMAGSGGGIAYNRAEFDKPRFAGPFNAAPSTSASIEESLLGWKEYELEVIRDNADNFGVICTIENLDPMGVHTGDSITVAPRDDAHRPGVPTPYEMPRATIITEIGVDTGGSNIQFSVNPKDGRRDRHRDEPTRFPLECARLQGNRATRSRRSPRSWRSAIASTSFSNDITGTSSAFEPHHRLRRYEGGLGLPSRSSPGADPRLTTQMKSVGEAMAIGRTFKESSPKSGHALSRSGTVTALDLAPRQGRLSRPCGADSPSTSRPARSINTGQTDAPGSPRSPPRPSSSEAILEVVRTPLSDRLWYMARTGLRVGLTRRRRFTVRQTIDPLVPGADAPNHRVREQCFPDTAGAPLVRGRCSATPKSLGFTDRQIADAARRGSPDDRSNGFGRRLWRRADLLPRRHVCGGVSLHSHPTCTRPGASDSEANTSARTRRRS